MTDRPASWRMPTPKQMEKLAAAAVAVRENAVPMRTPGPGDEMPPEYWQAVMDDPLAEAGTEDGRPSARLLRLSEISQHILRVSRAGVPGPSRSRRPMPSASTGQKRPGRTSDKDCSTTHASNGPGAMRKTAVGPRSSSRRRRRSVPEPWMSGWRRNTTPRPSPEATAKP
jgi:hypothetical protein